MTEEYNLEASRLRLDAAFKALENLVEMKILKKVEEGSKFLELEHKIANLCAQNSQIQKKLQDIAVTIDKSIAKVTSLVEEENANS